MSLKNLMFVFDRMPGPDGCIFIEVENAEGQSVCAGEWREREDGLVELVVPVSYSDDAQRLRADTAEATVAERDEALALISRDLIEAQMAVTGWARKHAAAEQRIAELEKDAARWNFFSSIANELQAFPHSWGKMTPEKMNHMCDEAMIAALNPNPEAESHE